MLGYGASMVDAGDHDIGLSSQADRLLGWLEETGLEDAVLVGHDLGGALSRSPPPGRPTGSPASS